MASRAVPELTIPQEVSVSCFWNTLACARDPTPRNVTWAPGELSIGILYATYVFWAQERLWRVGIARRDARSLVGDRAVGAAVEQPRLGEDAIVTPVRGELKTNRTYGLFVYRFYF